MRNSPGTRWRRLHASLLTLWLVLSPTGLVGAATQTAGAVPFTIKAGGTLTGNLGASLSNDARARPATLVPSAPGSTAPGLITLTAPGYPYLIETDPRFTQFARFISSDYMLARLGLNPALIQKRLGDGYYERGSAKSSTNRSATPVIWRSVSRITRGLHEHCLRRKAIRRRPS